MRKELEGARRMKAEAQADREKAQKLEVFTLTRGSSDDGNDVRTMFMLALRN